MTIHKAQGLTLNKLCVDIGKKEFSAGLTFVAISKVRCLTDLLLKPTFSFQRLKNLAKSRRIEERKHEEKHLRTMEATTFTFITSQLPAIPFVNQLSSEGMLSQFIMSQIFIIIQMFGAPHHHHHAQQQTQAIMVCRIHVNSYCLCYF